VENDLRHCLPGRGRGPLSAEQAAKEAERSVMQITQVRGYLEAKPEVRAQEPLALPAA